VALFEGLSDKLQSTFKHITGQGKLNEKTIKEAMREVKLALLEADVNYKIVKDFIRDVTEKSLGESVMKSLTPGQQVVKIVKEELITLMGSHNEKLRFSSRPPTVIMMVGLQGAGKTTTAGKLGALLKKEGKNPLLVAGDIYRPAAIEQLKVVGEALSLPVFSLGDKTSPVQIATQSVKEATGKGYDVVILDTAGRLHLDENLMNELVAIKGAVQPDEILLVVDAMTGQDAVKVAEGFDKALDISGSILTKLDGDTRGGAALSLKAVTGKPVKFAGTGEKYTEFEAFHPERMVSRILGMGDLLSLIEKAEAGFDEEKARKLTKKMKNQELDLEDFLEQMQQMQNLGPIGDLMGMIPGMNNKAMKNIQVDEKEFVFMQAIIQSMTPKERRNPGILNGSRKKRIALGSGTDVPRVNRLIKQFEQTKKMIRQMGQMKGKFPGGGMNLPF